MASVRNRFRPCVFEEGRDKIGLYRSSSFSPVSEGGVAHFFLAEKVSFELFVPCSDEVSALHGVLGILDDVTHRSQNSVCSSERCRPIWVYSKLRH